MVHAGAPQENAGAPDCGDDRARQNADGSPQLHGQFFPKATDLEALTEAGFSANDLGQQFHWTNDGFPRFSAIFSRRLTSRKAARRSRRNGGAKALAPGLEIEVVTGSRSETPSLGRLFNEFYLANFRTANGVPPISIAAFFLRDDRRADAREKSSLIMARHTGPTTSPGPFNLLRPRRQFTGPETGAGYGRLQIFCIFECCYYQANRICHRSWG